MVSLTRLPTWYRSQALRYWQPRSRYSRIGSLITGENELTTAFSMRRGLCASASRVQAPPQENDITWSAAKCSINSRRICPSVSLVSKRSWRLCALDLPA
ncbi:hypothetical protein D3C78_1553230 [compost metagenome]